MINLENYRSSTEYREILRILQKSTMLQDNILWQSHVSGKVIIPVQYLEIDFIAREVQVVFDADSFQIEKTKPVFVKLGHRMSVFKISQFRLSQNALHFSFPEIIKTPELRSIQRHQFLPKQDKTVTLRSSLTGAFGDMGTELKVRVSDISFNGIGLIVSENNRQFLKNNRILWISALSDLPLENPIVAEVLYINNEVDTRFNILKQKLIKSGLKLSESIPPSVFHHFLS